MKKLIALFITLALVLSGCAMFGEDRDSDLVLELATRAATGRVLDEKPSWACPAAQITQSVLNAIDGKVELDAIERHVVTEIAWDELNAEEQMLVATLVSAARDRIKERLTDLGEEAPGERVVFVREFIGWINQTAQLRCQ